LSKNWFAPHRRSNIGEAVTRHILLATLSSYYSAHNVNST